MSSFAGAPTATINDASVCRASCGAIEAHAPQEAEREGFEPPMEVTPHNGFRDRRIQPLCHLSAPFFSIAKGR